VNGADKFIELISCWGRPTSAPHHNEAAGAGLTKGSTMSTTEDLRKDELIEVRKLHLAAGELSNDELAAVTGGGSIRIVCDDHIVIGTRPTK
jgi:bacteriocin-like protein